MSENTKPFLIFCGIASVIGALTGLVLSFTALSPLIIGGILGSIAPALLVFFLVFMKDPIENEDLKISPICLGTIALASIVIGAGLTTTAATIFPGVTIGAGSAALTGAVIGALAFIAGAFVTSYVVDPIVEKVNECFSSKDKE
ncbi:hypothetical protein [Wolbachia endosymbiont of Ctenocephalides felis wCfeJ]|uniref:hypothetical protein n=1 Tax=Wolbachia endosymbiont of Ctenocephalides felis wCfeJ TaxID=2732594 RepID=UPI001447209E|nr:hypothetical protein [Wolbachia endosymbiont of Ctenocephalides felis wCfeJ]WCR57961.1 MAG: hypothetical protein PG980_000433 [Wolbachia endosymbiont of Ctenocephalides felis wCfeJ]